MNLKLIKTEHDYDLALERLNILSKAKLNINDTNELNTLVKLVEEYEQIHYPFSKIDVIDRIKYMPEENKVLLLLVLSQQIVSKLSQKQDQNIAQQALDLCWTWMQTQNDIGEYLYNILDDENSKGITIIQEMSEINKDKMAWDCIIDAVAYTSRKAYEKTGANFFPEPIALVDDTLINHFIECYSKCIPKYIEYINKIEYYLSDYKIDRNKTLKDQILNQLIF